MKTTARWEQGRDKILIRLDEIKKGLFKDRTDHDSMNRLPDQFSLFSFKRVGVHISSTSGNNDQQVKPCWQEVLVGAEKFAHAPFDSVSLHR